LWLPILVLLSAAASAHIKVFPVESTLGAREKYVMRVPNEKLTPTVRIEGEFPAELKVYSFEAKPGWKIDIKKNSEGQIVGATWSGMLGASEFVEFGLLAVNPKQGKSLTWKFIQHFADGSKEEFVSAPGTSHPAPTVTLK
jgi:uncharacterized protein YcnI